MKGLFAVSKPVREWLPYKDDDREPGEIAPLSPEHHPVPPQEQDEIGSDRNQAVETLKRAADKGDTFARHLLEILECKETEANHGT